MTIVRMKTDMKTTGKEGEKVVIHAGTIFDDSDGSKIPRDITVAIAQKDYTAIEVLRDSKNAVVNQDKMPAGALEAVQAELDATTKLCEEYATENDDLKKKIRELEAVVESQKEDIRKLTVLAGGGDYYPCKVSGCESSPFRSEHALKIHVSKAHPGENA